MRIGFLFNHDATHQVPHTIPIAAALAARGVDVVILTSSEEQRGVASALLPAVAHVQFIDLTVGPMSRAADRLLRHVAPFKRLAILRDNLDVFRSFDALVVPEITSTFLKTRFGLSALKLIYLPHGAGDGAAGFQPATRHFDLVLLSGSKVRDRMFANGLITKNGHAIVGYPKFDHIGPQPPARFFDNDRPIVLYNPHFNPWLSSWYPHGRQVLEWFAAQDRFNLIVAPHVMLFKRLLHTSIIHRKTGLRPGIPKRFLNHPGILIDKGSRRSIDMSYVRAADIYLGDVSSQIYEWIQRPRPAIFFNTHKPEWRDAAEYRHWALGEVIRDIGALPPALDRAMANPNAFADRQAAAASETFSVTDRPAGERAADAILVYLEGQGVRGTSSTAPNGPVMPGT
jgi:CDP-Glycerol:Poly(glycerophosphate) glycerophosphotransferase